LTHLHPKPDDDGKPFRLRSPSTPTPLHTWSSAHEAATVVPGGPMPPVLNGLAVERWTEAPRTHQGWEALAATSPVSEPPFDRPYGFKAAAGAVVMEPDGRFWLVSPSNRFAGYVNTFPKGTVDAGASLQATALKEVFEESGLQVRLTAHLADLRRSQSYTRYYLARRLGGHPADMGWESQAVHLVPRERLADFLTNTNDAKLLEAILALGNASACAGRLGP
jgi:ADP-ribose pyrophosphatase YjhB (NUDIX family)